MNRRRTKNQKLDFSVGRWKMRREIGTWRRLNTVERKSRRLDGRKQGRMVAAKVEVLSYNF